MSLADTKPLRADAQRNRVKVIAAAERVLARDGAAASMREIARLAGVGLATIYRQFPTKEVLFEEITLERLQRLIAHTQAAVTGEYSPTAVFDLITFAVTESTGQKALADALAQAGVDPKAGAGPLIQQLETTTQLLLTRAQDAGDIRDDVALREVIALITASCLAADRQRWDHQLRTRTLAVIFDGLRPRN